MFRRAGLRRSALALAASLAASACVVWPAGSGPGAEPMALAEAVDRCGRGEAVLVDLRTPQEYAAGHFAGAINVPLDEIGSRLAELRRLRRLPVLYCG